MQLPIIPNDLKDRAAWAVYADALQQRGDPKGELVALDLKLDELPQCCYLFECSCPARPLLEAKEKNTAWLALSDSRIARKNRFGFATSLWWSPDQPVAFNAQIKSLDTRFVSGLHISGGLDLQEAIPALRDLQLKNLAILILDPLVMDMCFDALKAMPWFEQIKAVEIDENGWDAFALQTAYEEQSLL